MKDFSIDRFVFAGHVDHGKSALVGRLQHELDGRAVADSLEVSDAWAFRLDRLEEEMRELMTIETTQLSVDLGGRRLVLVDVPGHRRLLRNMLTGAAGADAAVLVVAADEGVGPQTELHARVLAFLRIPIAAAAVSKMDLVGYEPERYGRIVDALQAGPLADADVPVTPVCAFSGCNLVRPSARMRWCSSPPLLDLLKAAPVRMRPRGTIRFPVQDVYDVRDGPVAAGRSVGGPIDVGASLLALPGRTECIVTGLHRFPPCNEPADTGESVALGLHPFAVARGSVLVSREERDLRALRSLQLHALWMEGPAPTAGRRLSVRCGTGRRPALVVRADWENEPGSHVADGFRFGTIALESDGPMVVDTGGVCPALSRFVLEDDSGRPLGICMMPRDDGLGRCEEGG